MSVLRANGPENTCGLGNRREGNAPLKPDECDAAGSYIICLPFNDLNHHYSSDFLRHFFPRSLAMPNPILKTTITRYVHMVGALDRPDWGYNSDELAKIDPMCGVAGFRFLPPTATQRPSDCTMPGVDSTLEFPWVPDLGSPHPVAPMGVTADKWSADSSLVFPSSDPLLLRSGLIGVDIPTSNRHAQENRLSTSLIHQTSPASIPTVAHQSRLHLPNESNTQTIPTSHIDTDWMPSCQEAPAGLNRQQSSSPKRRQTLQRVYDRPGKKLAAPYEPGLPRLQELSRQRGGQDFAIAWIPKVFKKGVTINALSRTLSEDEINAVDHDHGFRLAQAYDGFLEKVEDRFECGLCGEEKRANWRNKKDSIRHFQKFHFGIGETYGTW